MTRAAVTMKFLKDVDMSAFDALKKRIEGDGRVVNVGIPASAKEADGTPVAMIAAVQEFGNPALGIPERSFLRAGVRTNAGDFVQLNRINLVRILQGNMTYDQALGQLGAMAAGRVKQNIRDGSYAPLKAATVAARKRRLSSGYRAALAKKKGAPIEMDKPLIDSGQMWQSITFEIGPGK